MFLFSIVTICWNNLNELKHTYKTIKDQSFRDFEWIVVDGDSKDGTKEWLKDIVEANWVSEPDTGIFNAMNKGIRRAGGQYLIFMNSGDCFAADNVLEKVNEAIEKNNHPVFIYGDSLDVDEYKKEHYRKAKDHDRNWKGMITQHQSMFFSKDVIGSTQYIESFPITADYAFISEILQKAEDQQILKLDFPICKFDMGGLNEQQRFKALKEDFKIRKEIIGLSYPKNITLYLLHYLHTFLKKVNPAFRFTRHKSTN